MNQAPTPPLRGEVIRTTTAVDEVAVGLRNRGYIVGGVYARDKAEFLLRVGKALRFPSWYGRNLDALWDCLTDLTAPTALIWVNWADLAIDHPQDWSAIITLLRDRVQTEPAFTLVLATEPGSEPSADL